MRETERASAKYLGLDTWPDVDVLSAFWDGQMSAVAAVRPALPQIAAAVPAVVGRLRDDKSRMIYAGAGSSGLLAMQDGMELTPTFSWPLERLSFLMAGGDAARLKPQGVSEDDINSARADVAALKLTDKDVVIAVAASGTTPYTVEVVRQARAVGALVVSIANNPDVPLLELADYPILVETGPEVVAGSTRLGAGTAQKAVLGMLSSTVMTRLGHVVDGLMVSVVADNDKLVERAARIVAQIARCGMDDAARALKQVDGHVKPAVLVATGETAASALALLADCGGDLRAAMNRSQQSGR